MQIGIIHGIVLIIMMKLKNLFLGYLEKILSFIKPTAIPPIEWLDEKDKFNFIISSETWSKWSKNTDKYIVNCLKKFLNDTHNESIKQCPYYVRLDNCNIEKNHIETLGYLMIQSAISYKYKSIKYNDFINEDRYDKQLINRSTTILSEYDKWLRESNITAYYGFHADIIHTGNYLTLLIYPIFYFDNIDDQLMFKLAF